MDYKKPQSTLVQGGVGLYPLTTADQVILSDGSRLEKDGKINADSAADSAKLGGKAPEYYLQPRNLLDNSDFSNGRFVVQAGLNGLHGSTVYLGDRWIGDNRITAGQKQDHIVLTSTAQFACIVQKVHVEGGKTYTLAIKSTGADFYLGFNVGGAKERHHEGDVYTLQVDVPSDSNLLEVSLYPAFKDGGGTANIYWAALYEDAFKPKTLPPYVPNGYAAELAECQRYYYKTVVSNWDGSICVTIGESAFAPLVHQPADAHAYYAHGNQ